MGQGAEQTVRQIEEARERLGTELREFEDQLPGTVPTRRRALFPIAGAVVATGTAVLVVRGVRRRAKAKAAAQTFSARIIRRLPGRVSKPTSKTSEDERWKLWALAAGGVWMTFRLAELRQLKRLNRTLIVR